MGNSCGDCGRRSFGSQEEKSPAQVGGEGRQQAEAPFDVVLRGGAAPGGDGGPSWQGTREGSPPVLAEAGAPLGFQGSPGRSSSKSRSQSRACVCVCRHRGGQAFLCPLPWSAAVRTGLHRPGRAAETVEMITEPGPLGLSRGGVCVLRGDPQGGRVGGLHISAPNVHLVPQHAGAPPRGVGGDQTVCPAASMTGCREEGSPARVRARGTSGASSAPQPLPPRGLRAAGQGLSAAHGLKCTQQQRLLDDGRGFSGQTCRSSVTWLIGAVLTHSSGCRGRRGQGRAMQAASEPGPVVMKPGLSKTCLAARPFTAAGYYPEDKFDHIPQLLKVLGGFPWHRFSNFFFLMK